MTDNLIQTKQLQLDSITNKLENLIDTKSQESSKINHLEQKINNIENKLSYKTLPYLAEQKTKALSQFVRSGTINSNLVCKSLVAGDGGALIQNRLYSQIMNNISQKSILRNLASVDQISGVYLEVVKEEGAFTCGWVDEIQERSVTDNSQLIKQKIFLHEIYAQPKATQKLVDDSSIDLEAWITDNIINSFTKLENEAFINGNGEKKPFGILYYKNDPSITTVNLDLNLTSESILNIINSLEECFLENAVFLVNRSTLSKIQSLKDTNGRFIWQYSLTTELPQSIFGFPVVCCSNLPAFQKNNYPIIFGDFKAAYKIIDKSEISLVRDPYTEKPFIKFYTIKRVGGDIINKKALVLGKVV